MKKIYFHNRVFTKFVSFLVLYPILIFSLVTFIVFANVLFNHFVWLDFPYVVNNPQLSGQNMLEIIKGSTATAAGYYRPFSSLVLGIQKTAFSYEPFYYHFIQLILRIFNVTLLFMIFVKFIRRKVAIFLSLVYLVHPLNVTQIAFISAIADQLFMMFGLMALNIALQKKDKLMEVVSAQFFLFLSLLSKESGILFFIPFLFGQIKYGKKSLLSLL